MFEGLSVASWKACDGTWRGLVPAMMRRFEEACTIFCYMRKTRLVLFFAVLTQHWIELQLQNGGSVGCLEMHTQSCFCNGLTLRASPSGMSYQA